MKLGAVVCTTPMCKERKDIKKVNKYIQMFLNVCM